MAQDIIKYLNAETAEGSFASMQSRLISTLVESKQGKAAVSQWLPMIKALTTKGVKQIELDESGALTWLESLEPSQVLTKDDLLSGVRSRYYTIKEVQLGSPKFSLYRQPGGEYREYLYIANSEKNNVEDSLDEVLFEMEDLAFNPEKIAEDPGIVMRLEKRLMQLKVVSESAFDFSGHHFSDVVQGKLGRNLLAHCRASIHGDTYFIDEIQSDWAQRGRKSDWNGISRGPLVTSTEAWAGMVIRRQMQIAAGMPGIKRFAWITDTMRNGGPQNLAAEKQKEDQRRAYREFIERVTSEKLQQIGVDKMSPEQKSAATAMVKASAAAEAVKARISEPHDLINDFYLQVLPKLADKTLSKAKTKIALTEVNLGTSSPVRAYDARSAVAKPNIVKVPSVEMTPAVREALVATQPVYSRAPLRVLPASTDLRDEAIAEALKSALEMLGTTRHVRFAAHVYDIATGRQVAGRYINGLVQVSLRAQDIVEATEHECFHFAVDRLMHAHEVKMLSEEFAPNTELNFRVRTELTRRGMFEAARQCDDPLEAAAHGFTLWKGGFISVNEPPVRGLFSDLVSVVQDGLKWLKRVVLEHRSASVEDVFSNLASGVMAIEEERRRQAKSEQDVIRLRGFGMEPAPHEEEEHAGLAHQRQRIAG